MFRNLPTWQRQTRCRVACCNNLCRSFWHRCLWDGRLHKFDKATADQHPWDSIIISCGKTFHAKSWRCHSITWDSEMFKNVMLQIRPWPTLASVDLRCPGFQGLQVTRENPATHGLILMLTPWMCGNNKWSIEPVSIYWYIYMFYMYMDMYMYMYMYMHMYMYIYMYMSTY